jgi:hypothetical protein
MEYMVVGKVARRKRFARETDVVEWRYFCLIKRRHAVTVDEPTKQHGLGWFDLTLLKKVARTSGD